MTMSTFLSVLLPLAIVLIGLGLLMASSAGRLLIAVGTVFAGVVVVLVLVHA